MPNISVDYFSMFLPSEEAPCALSNWNVAFFLSHQKSSQMSNSDLTVAAVKTSARWVLRVNSQSVEKLCSL